MKQPYEICLLQRFPAFCHAVPAMKPRFTMADDSGFNRSIIPAVHILNGIACTANQQCRPDTARPFPLPFLYGDPAAVQGAWRMWHEASGRAASHRDERRKRRCAQGIRPAVTGFLQVKQSSASRRTKNVSSGNSAAVYGSRYGFSSQKSMLLHIAFE